MKFSYEKIEACCREMREIFAKIDVSLDTITECLNRLESSGSWQGKASQYYIEKLKNVTNTFEEVNISINNNIRYLEQTAESYNDLDKKIITSIAGVFDIKGSGN